MTLFFFRFAVGVMTTKKNKDDNQAKANDLIVFTQKLYKDLSSKEAEVVALQGELAQMQQQVQQLTEAAQAREAAAVISTDTTLFGKAVTASFAGLAAKDHFFLTSQTLRNNIVFHLLFLADGSVETAAAQLAEIITDRVQLEAFGIPADMIQLIQTIPVEGINLLSVGGSGATDEVKSVYRETLKIHLKSTTT